MHNVTIGTLMLLLIAVLVVSPPNFCCHYFDTITTCAAAEPMTIDEPEHREPPSTLDEPIHFETVNSAAENSVAGSVATAAPSASSPDNSSLQQQVEALWDAVKWMEDRVETIDVERREELQEASRVAAQNTARVRHMICNSCYVPSCAAFIVRSTYK